MKKTFEVLTLMFSIYISLAFGVQFIETANANPISIPIVPTIQVSQVSDPQRLFGEFVNSTVEFEIHVNMFVGSPTLNLISYSLDGEAAVDLENLRVTDFYDYGPSKIDYKTYKANIVLKDLSEGNHTLAAYANDMSASRDFIVNSYYHVTALNVLSPNSPFYSTSVPLTFTYTGDIENAHYYLYRGRELVSEKSLSGNMVLDNLSDGFYDLYFFVTTEYGQDSKMIHFYVVGIPTIVGIIVLLVSSIAISSLVYFKKFNRKK